MYQDHDERSGIRDTLIASPRTSGPLLVVRDVHRDQWQRPGLVLCRDVGPVLRQGAAIDAEVRLYDRLFTVAEPDAEGDFKKHLNEHSLEVITAKLEPSLREARPEHRYQFERLAYFCLDEESSPTKLVFNRTITLKDTWSREAGKA